MESVKTPVDEMTMTPFLPVDLIPGTNTVSVLSLDSGYQYGECTVLIKGTNMVSVLSLDSGHQHGEWTKS